MRKYTDIYSEVVAHFVRDEGVAGSSPVIPICHPSSAGRAADL